MLILGIDPGTATSGFGFVRVNGNGLEVGEFGLIETDKSLKQEKRLDFIHKDLKRLIKDKKPDVLAIERVFFATNAKTAISVGQAIGVMMLAASHTKTPIIEYAPGTIKKVVAGNGRADKKEVQKYVRKVLGGKVKSKKNGKTHFDNAADALAVAICHAHSEGLHVLDWG